MERYPPIIYAFLAALLFGLNAPFAKLLVGGLHPLFLAALLYLGAGLGMLIVKALSKLRRQPSAEAPLSRKELPAVIAMVVLDIAAPVLLLWGLSQVNSSTAALLGNFEIAATAIIAMIVFKESIGRRLWLAIGLIILASVILSVNDVSGIAISAGAILVLLATVCWGLENNCTRSLSIKDPLQIVIIKGFGSGLGALLIASLFGKLNPDIMYVGSALLLGFVAYGLSIFFYVKAQRYLGAARTSAYYAAAPFIGVIISWIVWRDPLTISFLAALGAMLVGAYLAVSENHEHAHRHISETHEHKHRHDDGHHKHVHENAAAGEHSHLHTHQAVEHRHAHWPDPHHRHSH